MKLDDFVKGASRKRKGRNRELFRGTARRLRRVKHEEHYRQANYAIKTECGTACCIAGWALIAAGLTTAQVLTLECSGKSRLSIRRAAINLLGLTDFQASRLFNAHGTFWPEPFGERFYESEYGASSERPSQIAADLLDAIADGKVKL